MKLIKLFPLSIIVAAAAAAFTITGCGGAKCDSGGYNNLPCIQIPGNAEDHPYLFELASQEESGADANFFPQ